MNFSLSGWLSAQFNSNVANSVYDMKFFPKLSTVEISWLFVGFMNILAAYQVDYPLKK
jgi:hypothetical protein